MAAPLLCLTLKPFRKLQADKEAVASEKGKAIQSTAPAVTTDMIGLHLSHVSFGQGVIVEVINSGYIFVDFQDVGVKTLSYQLCMELGILTFE